MIMLCTLEQKLSSTPGLALPPQWEKLACIVRSLFGQWVHPLQGVPSLCRQFQIRECWQAVPPGMGYSEAWKPPWPFQTLGVNGITNQGGPSVGETQNFTLNRCK